MGVLSEVVKKIIVVDSDQEIQFASAKLIKEKLIKDDNIIRKYWSISLDEVKRTKILIDIFGNKSTELKIIGEDRCYSGEVLGEYIGEYCKLKGTSELKENN